MSGWRSLAMTVDETLAAHGLKPARQAQAVAAHLLWPQRPVVGVEQTEHAVGIAAAPAH